MTRKTKATPKRFPSVNMNDGRARLIITFCQDITEGIDTIGRYGVTAGVALSAAIEAMPSLRMAELEETGAMMQGLTDRINTVTEKIDTVVNSMTEEENTTT